MKQTPVSTAVLEILQQQSQPLSAPRLLELLAEKSLSPNKTTLYRLLDRLVEAGHVEAVLLSDKAAHYEIKGTHHHHFVCKSCDKIACIDDPQLEQKIHHLEDQLKQDGYQVEDHQFSLSGTCKTCN